jgi:hypothetical protein
MLQYREILLIRLRERIVKKLIKDVIDRSEATFKNKCSYFINH